MQITLTLNAVEEAALMRFIAQHARPYTPEMAARLLLRDALIGIGDLPLPGSNRSRWAGGRRGSR